MPTESEIIAERKKNTERAAKRRSESRESYNAYMREWRERNKERINAELRIRRKDDPAFISRVREQDKKRYAKNPNAHRNERLKSVYGITLDRYMEMYATQQGKCAICGDERPDGGKTGLVVDHCHTHGHVRKLLCPPCNTGLGQFKDDDGILAKAIEYLKLKLKD